MADDQFPDKVAYLRDGWAVRFNGAIESGRWNTKGAADAHLSLLQAGACRPQPDLIYNRLQERKQSDA